MGTSANRSDGQPIENPSTMGEDVEPKPFRDTGSQPNPAPADHGITTAIIVPGLKSLGTRVTVDYKGREVTDHQWTSRWHVRSSLANADHPPFDRMYFDRPQPRPLYRTGPGANDGNQHVMSTSERLEAVRKGQVFSFTVPRIGSLSLNMMATQPLPSKRKAAKRNKSPFGAPPKNCVDIEWLRWWENIKATNARLKQRPQWQSNHQTVNSIDNDEFVHRSRVSRLTTHATGGAAKDEFEKWTPLLSRDKILFR